MKIQHWFAVAIFSTAALNSFAQPLNEGDSIAGGGLGFGSYGGFTLGAFYEQGLIDDIAENVNLSVGGIASYTNYTYLTDYTVSRTFIGGQANLQYYQESFGALAPYVGITLGYDIVTTDFTGSIGSGITGGAQVGTRYYFSDDMAANVRLGWPYSIVGIELKL